MKKLSGSERKGQKHRIKRFAFARKYVESPVSVSFTSFQEECRALGISFMGYLSLCLALAELLKEERGRSAVDYTLGDLIEVHESIRREKGISKRSVSRTMNMDRGNCARFFRQPWQKSTNMQRILDMSLSLDMSPIDFFRRVDEYVRKKEEENSSGNG